MQIKLKPKIQGLQVKNAQLWVDPETGMPLRLELRIGLGPWDPPPGSSCS